MITFTVFGTVDVWGGSR